MKKLNFSPRTIDDVIVKDGLCAVGALSLNPFSKDLSFIVGGMATQSYLPSSCRRGTCDIDLAVLRPLGGSDFKEFVRTAKDFLQDNGYDAELKKGQNAYHLIYSKSTGENISDAAVIEFARRGENYIRRSEQRLIREFENSRKKIVEGRDVTYRVSSPEDIIVPKLVRSVGALQRNPDFMQYVGYEGWSKSLSEDQIEKELRALTDLRNEVILNPGDPSMSERLRFVADSFDIRLLSEQVGVNEPYLRVSINDWGRLTEVSKERSLLFGYLLPDFAL